MDINKKNLNVEKTADLKTVLEADILKDALLKNFSENAVTVLKKRYLAKNTDGSIIENISGMFERVAENISEADYNYNSSKENVAKLKHDFYDEMSNLRFLPNSPTLMNAGRPLQQLSACFVLPIEDSMSSIFETLKNTALIHQSGGGTGFSFSKLRPKNDVVHSTKGVSSGPVSFMQVFNAATEAVKQGGTRRGANMGILNIDHPDIIDFITSKKDTSKLNNFNISVAITEDFINKVLKNEKYPLINPRNKEIVKYLNAKEVLNTIIELAWKSGEPGIIFIDRINKLNPVPSAGMIESTNPCGEQPLIPYESCNLGSINIGKFVKKHPINIGGLKIMNSANHSDDYYANFIDGLIDWESLRKTVHIATHFLDNVIDKNNYPLDKIKETTLSNRKIGLGLMGYADTLIKLDIPYNSNIALQTAEKIMEFINSESKEKSQELGKIRGSFPNFENSIWKTRYKAMRNATTTTIAPTGTISIIGGASSGIEPLFALSYERHVLDNQSLIEIDKNLKDKFEELGIFSDELINFIAKEGKFDKNTYQNWKHQNPLPLKINPEIKKLYEKNGEKLEEYKIFDYLSSIFITSHDILPKWHVLTQAAFQKYTDNAVSKTVNFPHDATKEDIEEVYTQAYKLNLKGITVYRDGSREQVLTTPKSQERKTQNENSITNNSNADNNFTELNNSNPSSIRCLTIEPRKRPDIIHGVTIKTVTGCGPLYVTVNKDENGAPFEIFNSIGKSGGCAQSQTESIGRMVSMALRSGIDAEEIISQLKGIRCNQPYGFGENIIYSCADAIGKALEKSLKEMTYPKERNCQDDTSNNIINKNNNNSYKNNHKINKSNIDASELNAQFRGACPSCGGSNLKHAEGCTVCLDCGYSDCG
jgi:ribonucleoside-diphosphate reductase alpha chain